MTTALRNTIAENLLLATQIAEVNAICVSSVWGEETLSWQFYPVRTDHNTGETVGYFMVWTHDADPRSSAGAIVWNDDEHTMSEHLTLALPKLRQIMAG